MPALMRSILLLAALCLAGACGAAEPQVVDVPTRPDVSQRFLYLPVENPTAALILFAGGHGGLQLSEDGAVRGLKGNFLVRSRELFTAAGLDFELFVFVSNLEDRLTVMNALNRTLLARLIEEKIIDPKAVPELRLRDIDKLGAAFRGEQSPRPPTKEGSSEMGTEGTDDAAAAPKD